MLKCPRTGKPMVEVEIDGILVDVSTGCGGVWFDNFELKKFDEQHEQAGQELLKVLEQYHQPVADLDRRLHCPKDKDIVMMRRFFSIKRSVSIDECPACGGIWLDPGELAEVRNLYKTEAEREEAGRKFIAELAESSGLKQMAAENEARADSARRFGDMLGWGFGLGFRLGRW
jgi:uncharacterized protein